MGGAGEQGVNLGANEESGESGECVGSVEVFPDVGGGGGSGDSPCARRGGAARRTGAGRVRGGVVVAAQGMKSFVQRKNFATKNFVHKMKFAKKNSQGKISCTNLNSCAGLATSRGTPLKNFVLRRGKSLCSKGKRFGAQWDL